MGWQMLCPDGHIQLVVVMTNFFMEQKRMMRKCQSLLNKKKTEERGSKFASLFELSFSETLPGQNMSDPKSGKVLDLFSGQGSWKDAFFTDGI